MAYFAPIRSVSFLPEAYLPIAPYIPVHFLQQQQVTDITKFNLERDELGQISIIQLNIDNEILIPFIDLSKYDPETKDWFWFDDADNLPYRFQKSNNSLENIYSSPYSNLTLSNTPSFDKNKLRIVGQFSDSNEDTYEFYKYSPLLLVVNNRAYTDLSDYSTFLSTNRLNKMDITIPEYYYDFNSRIYTNQNLAGIDPSQVKIYYYKVSNNTAQVKCRMSANIGSNAFYTPKVDSFIVKLKGQSLRV